MSRRHRSEAAVLPPKQELRAHARSERHRINSELHSLSTALGRTVEVDDADEPGIGWKPLHHHDGDLARRKAARGRRVRHWKVKAWKRRTALRRRRAEALRLVAEA